MVETEEINLLSNHWMPSCDFSAKRSNFADQTFRDFDEQAQQLIGHDQSYTQLTAGAFRGRFFSAFLGAEVAVHMEVCNQALEQEVAGSADHFSFGVVLSEGEYFRANGRDQSKDDVFVIPPSGALHMISPVHGAVLAISVNQRVLLEHANLVPAVGDWLGNLGPQVGFLRSPRLATRLREDVVSAVESAAIAPCAVDHAMVGAALLGSIVSKLSLEWSGAIPVKGWAGEKSFDRFWKGRGWLLGGDGSLDDHTGIVSALKQSRRTVEQAFSDQVSLGPLTYLRIHRLHKVRRCLQNDQLADQTIGDIAAEHGFWDWSRFTQHYRRHFGELPSTTRQISMLGG